MNADVELALLDYGFRSGRAAAFAATAASHGAGHMRKPQLFAPRVVMLDAEFTLVHAPGTRASRIQAPPPVPVVAPALPAPATRARRLGPVQRLRAHAPLIAHG